jgi:4-methyl-5(b-hydroxyethyl)-thiazole monophosphate biosynthesis
VELTVAAVGSARLVTGSHGIAVQADGLLDELKGEVEGVVVPGGMPGAANIAASVGALNLIRETFRTGRLVAAICAAPAVALSAAGILSGRKATCFPGYEEKLKAAGAEALQERVVVDGNLITSRGAGTAAEFALALIERLIGPDKAREIRERTLQKA